MSIVVASIHGITPYVVSAAYPEPLAQYRKQAEKQPKPPLLRARDIMTKAVITVTASVAVHEAWATMQKHRFKHLPVVDTLTAQIVGMVSDRDLLHIQSSSPALVATIMKSPIITAHPETTLKELATVMLHERISCIPIIDHGRMLCGIVTSTDILRAVMAQPLDTWG